MRAITKFKIVTGWASLEGQWLRRRHFNEAMLARVAKRIREAETGHAGELMLAIEASSPVHEPDSALRALEVFGRLRVWDTPGNTGVLLYLALDRRVIHIIADRGVQGADAQWAPICGRLQDRLRIRDYEAGILSAIDEIEAVLGQACPLDGKTANPNDLPDRPVLL